MRKRDVVAGLLFLLLPAPLRGQGLAIDHRAVGCVVAGQHPRLTACFAPASQLARGRVYFRVAGGAPDWYYVEMRSDAPCHSGVLPRPKKELVGRQIEYYVDALDRKFAESRSPETLALVVGNAGQCTSKLPVAPIVNGATVAVFPGLPAGFAGAAAGIGAGTTALAVVGGAAVVGGGVAVASGSGGESSGGGGGGGGATTTVPPTTTLPPVTTTTTTTLPNAGLSAVFKVFQDGALVEGGSTAGTEPLKLVFDMCESAGPLPLRYAVEVDGVQMTAGCHSSIAFTTASASPGFSGSAAPSSGSRTYAVTLWVRSQSATNNPKASRSLLVQVNAAGSGGCSGDTTGPVVSLTSPTAGSIYPSPVKYPVLFEASASDATTGNNGVAFVEYKVNYGKPGQKIFGPVTSGDPWSLRWTEPEVNAYLGTACAKFLDVQAYAADNCGNTSITSAILVIVNNTGSCTPDGGRAGSAAAATIVSELGVPAGVGQVVVNGEVTFPRAGRATLAVRPAPGENRLEATLVEARAGGTWRFELAGIPGLRAETVRVVAGEVVQLAADAVTFRLAGRPGERVVLAFQASP